jgi:hypothetical protein
MMCKKFIIVLALSLLLISSAGAETVTWDFENGNDHNFILQSTYYAWPAWDDPNTAGDESITGVGGAQGLPDAGIAWTVGPPTQFDGQKPAADVEHARVDANGLLDYSLGTERIATESGTLNTFNLNQHGDYIHTQENDQIASSPIVTLDANAVLTVWSWGGGNGTHAPEYDPDPAFWYTDGSSGIAVISAEEDDLYAILATIHTQGKGTRTEDTLDLSAFAGRKVFLDVVDAFEGGWGWLAIDEIQITNATSKTAGFIVQLVDGEPTMGFDTVQIARLETLGYNVKVVNYTDVESGVFTSAEADRYDLLIISESPNSNACNNLIGTAVPVMHQEAYGWDNWSFMGPADNIHWLATQTEVEVVNDTHPIMVDAGFPIGMLPWFTLPDQYTTENISNMAPGAELLCKAAAEESAVVFAMEEGAELYDGNSVPNRVVGFSIPGNTDGPNFANGMIDASIMSDEQWALYDAAIRWLDPPDAPPAAAMVVSNTDLSAGFDQAQKDRLESLGYEVTVTTGDDVQNGVFTAADAETFDVLVVSESIGSSAANNLIGANVPMMHQESYGWSRHFFTTGLKKTWVNEITTIDVVADHEILTDAGLSAGPLDFFTAPTNATSDLVASLVPGAVNLAQVTVDANDFTLVFAIEAGTELADTSLAANRIVGFSLPGTAGAIDASVMTDEAWAFFDAAIAWLDAVD